MPVAGGGGGIGPPGGGGGPSGLTTADVETVVLDDLSLNEGALGESYDAYNPAAALGRIGGKLLKDNLLRNGVDLSFRNLISDPDVLYLDVTNMRVGINTSTPMYDLDINSEINTKKLEATNQATIGNLVINAPNTFSTVTGPIDVVPGDTSIPFSHHVLQTSGLEIRANYIGSVSNGNIVLDPSGTLELQTTTDVTGDVNVTGNINVQGNLSGAGTITIGDQTTDVVTVTPDLSQTVLPGVTSAYDLGSPTKRWANVYAPDWKQYNNFFVNGLTVSDQTFIDGVNNKISGIQSNEDISLSPDSGITQIEQLKFEQSTITNLLDSPLTLSSTGTGYFKIADENAFVMPRGSTAEAPVSPEVGFTRWNTDKGYVECFDGSIYIIATGPGDVVSRAKMEEYVNLWTIVLG